LIDQLNNELKASILMMASLIFCLTWHFLPDDVFFVFPFFDEIDDSFSLNPEEYRRYNLKILLPFFVEAIMPFIYIPCLLLSNSMIRPVGRFKINIWHLYFIWEGLKTLDFMLSFSQTPYLRTIIIIIILAVHAEYIICKTDNSR